MSKIIIGIIGAVIGLVLGFWVAVVYLWSDVVTNTSTGLDVSQALNSGGLSLDCDEWMDYCLQPTNRVKDMQNACGQKCLY